MNRISPKEITQHQALVSKIFNIYQDQHAEIFLWIKYFAVSTCELFETVQPRSIAKVT